MMNAGTDPLMYQTYHSLMSDPDMDPFGTGNNRKPSIAKFMEEWRPNNRPLDSATMFKFMRDTFHDKAMGRLLVFTSESGTPRLHMLLGVRKYRITTKNQTSPLWDKDFAYLNDVVHGQAALVCFNAQHLEVVSNTRINVLKSDHMENCLTNNPTYELVPPMKDDAASKEVIQMRGIMWCPPESSPWLLEGIYHQEKRS